MLGVVPRSVLARLRMWFNTKKSFLLPTALPGVRKLRKLYRDNDPCELLVVGHADTTAGAATNDPLSLERAKSVIAFLEDDVDAWLAFYETGIPEARRWGSVEDRLMIVSMPGFADKPKGQDKVRWFQQTRGLGVDGKAGPETRRKLIEEYMSLDGASLADEGLRITATAHGCGEHFPLDDTGEGLDPKPADPKRDPVDRRVELFFFEPEFGIVPKPPGENSAAGSAQYPEWRRSVTETHELGAGDVEGPRVLFLELVDALFRTNSAVIMPEGERPSSDSGEHEAFTSLGVFATVLRFNDEHPGKKLLIAGHTDTTASVDFNQTLSEERARVALALLVGGDDQREEWKTLCDGRHTISDIKQILAWAPKGLAPLVFDCDPGRIDEVEGTLVEPLRRFQNAYNANKAELNPLADDLAPDGDLGPLTWGAVFDCYELALRRELKLERPELEALRAKVEFVDPEQRALGFSEHFPVEELGVDNFKSQSNRRVEILFFDPDEAPDVPSMASDPETAEIYLPGRYEREPLEPLLDRFIDLEIRLHDGAARPLGAVPCRMTLGSDVQEATASADGFVTFALPGLSCPDLAKLEWGVPEADGSFPFSREILVECEEGEERQQATAKLFNLGYPSFTDEEFAQAVKDFQFDYDIPEQGLTSGNALPAETRRRLFTIYATDCDATRPERGPADDDPAAEDDEELEIVSSAGSCFDGLA
jgi:outer membrane protein OmpA-like peptidoglycan-associated protein